MKFTKKENRRGLLNLLGLGFVVSIAALSHVSGGDEYPNEPAPQPKEAVQSSEPAPVAPRPVSQPAPTPEPIYSPDPEPVAIPLTPEEQLQERLVINTPGLLAKERAGLLDPYVLYHELFPILCGFTMDDSIPLDQTRALLTDMAQRNFGVDQKLAQNMAQGMVETAVEPGNCP